MSESSNNRLTIRLPATRASSVMSTSMATSAATVMYEPDEEQRAHDAKLDERVGPRDEISSSLRENAVPMLVPHTHAGGFVIETGGLVRVRGPRHPRTLHVVNYDAIVVEQLESRSERKPLVKVRSLYSYEDLETAYISPKSRHPSIIRLVQGKKQVVLGDFDEIVLLENIIAPLTDIARVRLDGVNLPFLTPSARWIREDVTVAQANKVRNCVLLGVDDQGVACCSSEHCTSGTFYYPEEQPLRYCTHCERWYHVRCMRQIGTVASIRSLTYAQGSAPPSWIVWKAPASTPSHVASDLEHLVTLPIQRGYLLGPPGAHPLLSFEITPQPQHTLTLTRLSRNTP
ncbi:hypothetical protein K466DRAFT_570838 [Polyporus arcularius HHB13444]|uniref:Uncharacterized protein n=1 Tax=Polyporus arcularius HHB13444 TaxID=1314778 RepID=A0A5C3NMJ2_9APHY|nr:hypothetical protein K466DRAFT_570838 [Polyporus arcularius HHB13444]